jgi:hypothetical protein
MTREQILNILTNVKKGNTETFNQGDPENGFTDSVDVLYDAGTSTFEATLYNTEGGDFISQEKLYSENEVVEYILVNMK